MRDIKFRGKMLPENEWIYGTLLKIPHPPVCMGKEESDKYYIQFVDPRYMPDWNMPYKMVQGEVNKETIGQFTGLHDKNGKEIYEGDIVRQVSYKFSNDEYGHKGFYENISKVLYKGRAFQYEWIKTNEIEMPKDFKESFIEVIGNIYDNPDLLEKGSEE